MLYVYCTDCIHFRLDDESRPYCWHCNECDIEDYNYRKPIEQRPFYEREYKYNYDDVHDTCKFGKYENDKKTCIEKGKVIVPDEDCKECECYIDEEAELMNFKFDNEE